MSALESYPLITPFLWFDQNAQQAVDFYLTVFPNSRILDTLPGPNGIPVTIAFELDGAKFTALNGGPYHTFTEAISFVIRCDSQQQIDDYWAKLLPGGKEIQCGWLKDQFGLCWQVVPGNLPDLVRHPKAMQAMMQMVKFDIDALKAAAGGPDFGSAKQFSD